MNTKNSVRFLKHCVTNGTDRQGGAAMSVPTGSDQLVADPIVPKLEALADHLYRIDFTRESRLVADAVLVINELARRPEVMRNDIQTVTWRLT